MPSHHKNRRKYTSKPEQNPSFVMDWVLNVVLVVVVAVVLGLFARAFKRDITQAAAEDWEFNEYHTQEPGDGTAFLKECPLFNMCPVCTFTAAQIDRLSEHIANLQALPVLGNVTELYNQLSCHHTNQLEGSTLRLDETTFYLTQQRAIPHANAFHLLEMKACFQTEIHLIPSLTDAFNISTLLELHSMLFEQTLWRDAGVFRKENVRLGSVKALLPDWRDVPTLLDQFATWGTSHLNDTTGPESIFSFVACAHWLFERIHPFFDGNGRVGRIMANIILQNLALPPMLIISSEKLTYMHALQSFTLGQGQPLCQLAYQSVLRSARVKHYLTREILAGRVVDLAHVPV
eukprot:TRINITY_DN11616_c0_g1_i2.p1 TRINITY_DN11616_c0_g1~~TRINITY_DN11616_c0_g1_i2.p1  ORF type:complete len:347 (+),score=35.67 TRINITY_DN11616_c0_g1_i2:196-1236(+)